MFLRLPNAEIGPREIATLWSRLVVRPVFGLSVSFAAGQYFKLAFLAQPSPSGTILAPFLAAPNPPHEITLAFLSLYRPACLQEEHPPTPPIRLFPQVASDPQEPDLGLTHSPPRLPQPLRHSLSSDDNENFLDLGTGTSLVKAATSAGITMSDPSTSVPRMRLDRVQAAMQSSQGSGLLGELTVYDATERRLWDEFDELGRIDDTEALRQRDEAAHRCLAALDREIDAVGRAGRELPSALTEARAKFSLLCQLAEEGAATKAAQRISRVEKSFAKAEDDLIAATSSHRRSLACCRRQGQAPPASEAVSAARATLTRVHLELVKEIRLAAQFAQLGLVEITGLPGFARAIRAAGPVHADPLLERLLRHSRWCDQQANWDPVEDPVPENQAPAIMAGGKLTNLANAEAMLENLELTTVDQRSGISSIGSSGRHKLVQKAAQAVVLKHFVAEEKDSCLQEVRALQKLKDHPNVIKLLKAMKSGDGSIYLELPLCAGGSMLQWCEKFGRAVIQGDPDTFVRCLSIWRQIWQAIGYLHMDGVWHGRLTLDTMLLTAEQRPILTDFRCSVVAGQSGQRHFRFQRQSKERNQTKVFGGPIEGTQTPSLSCLFF
ncbi:unnamed protein product [Durusdinium trenchii]|uniref:Protein kinase domain-containing protein n=1 Tax=Durusdinium trenchii TaxID=1381693 RepID=A0ABP0Q146_9DINO